MQIRAVELNMEETGILCHLMMGQEEFRDAVRKGHTTDPLLIRWFALYQKLAHANDVLMGKVKG